MPLVKQNLILKLGKWQYFGIFKLNYCSKNITYFNVVLSTRAITSLRKFSNICVVYSYAVPLFSVSEWSVMIAFNL